MARNSDKNIPATTVGNSSVAQGRAKRTLTQKKGQPAKATQLPQARQAEHVVEEQAHQPMPTTIPAQVMMPPEMGEAFNAVKGAMDMFTTFMANQGQRRAQTPPRTGRQDGSMSSRVKEFINLDPPEFCGTNPEQDPLLWLEEIQKTLRVMKMTGNDAVELASYRLKDVAYAWFEMWEQQRSEEDDPPTWEEFTEAFIANFIPEEDREANATKFEQLRQGSMSVREYYMQFIKLARYAPYMVPSDKAKIRRFIIGLGDHIQDTTAAAAVSMKAFASVVGFAKSLEEKKQKRRVERDQNKKARTTGGFSGSVGGGSKGVFSKGFSAPAQSVPQSGTNFPGRHSQGHGSQSRQNQNFRTSVSQSQSSVGQPSNQKVTCSTCGKGHSGQCKIGMRGCYHCGDIGHLKYNCPKLPVNASKGSTYALGTSVATTATPTPARSHQTQPRRGAGRGSGSTIQGGGQPRLYAALDRRSAETSSAVVTDAGVIDEQTTS